MVTTVPEGDFHHRTWDRDGSELLCRHSPTKDATEGQRTGILSIQTLVWIRGSNTAAIPTISEPLVSTEISGMGNVNDRDGFSETNCYK